MKRLYIFCSHSAIIALGKGAIMQNYQQMKYLFDNHGFAITSWEDFEVSEHTKKRRTHKASTAHPKSDDNSKKNIKKNCD